MAWGVLAGDFNQETLDTLLVNGYDFYMSIEQYHPQIIGHSHIDPLDMPLCFWRVMGRDIQVKEIEAVIGGFYPLDSSDIAVQDAHRQLKEAISLVAVGDDGDHGFYFTGQSATVSFWKRGGNFYLFNSHACNQWNVHCLDEVLGDTHNKARVFKCEDAAALAWLLLSNSAMDGSERQYVICKVTFDIPDEFIQGRDLQYGFDVSDVAWDEVLGSEQENSIGDAISSGDESLGMLPDFDCFEDVPSSSGFVLPTSLNSTTPIIPVDAAGPVSQGPVEVCSSSDSDVPLALRLHAPNSKGEGIITPSTANCSSEDDVPLSARTRSQRRRGRKRRHVQPEPVDSAVPLARRLLSLGGDSGSWKRSAASPTSSVTSCSTNRSVLSDTSSLGRPKKKKRGRPKTSALSRKEQLREANRRYREKNREQLRNKAREYAEANPAVNRDAVERYNEAHPDIHREAVARYDEANPEVNREAVARYNEANPEVNREAVARYRAHHPDAERDRERARHLAIPMRRWPHLLGCLRGQELNIIQPHSLQKHNLSDPSIFRCANERCGCPFFEEERGRKKWCCGEGAYSVIDLPPLTSDFYDHPHFLQHPRRYNDLFAMCALRLSGSWIHPRTGVTFIKMQGRMYHQMHDLSYTGPGRNDSCLLIDDPAERSAFAENLRLNEVVVNAVAQHLNEVNPYVPLFKRLSNEPAHQARLVFQAKKRACDPANMLGYVPQTEVTAYMQTGDEPYQRRTVVVWRVGQARAHFLDRFSPLLEPFQYPLLYDQGTTGWFDGMVDNNGAALTPLRYLRWLLLSKPRFSDFERLSETWLVDMYSRVEEKRLEYLEHCQRQHQGAMRIAPLSELQGAVNVAQGDGQGSAVQPGGAQIRCPPARGRPHSRRGRGSRIGGRPQPSPAGSGRGSQSGFGGQGPPPDPAPVIPALRDETIQGEGGRVNAGKIFLPCSFVGGPRYMKTKYLDSMALVARLGGPTFFLTFTASGSWPESQANRHRPPQVPGRRPRAAGKVPPQITSRVFKLKLDELLRDLRSGRFFGRVAYIVYVIEFQSRGLPHAHICFRVENMHDLQNNDVDSFVRADIPSEEEAGGRLRELVLKHMMHGPCHIRQNLPCWDKDRHTCKKRFPKQATEVTHCDERGFWIYRRDPENTHTIEVNGQQVVISDCDVVPYNASLLLKYDAHINLEVASNRAIFAYLHKYIHKGNTLARVNVAGEEENEIEDYLTQRVMGSSEASWRTLEFDLTGREPTVSSLPVYLEGDMPVTYRGGQEADAVLVERNSPLDVYFKRPHDPEFDDLTYIDFYENYITHTRRPTTRGSPIWEFDEGRRFVTRRQRGRQVCRLNWVSPTKGEVYYLRMLLTRFPCRGYADLMALGGEECASYQQAARSQGLLEDDEEYVLAMEEAITFMTPHKLRNFFVVLCNIGAQTDILWDRFKDALSIDIYQRLQDRERAYTLALIHIDRGLRRNGSSNREQGLPDVEDDSTEAGRELLAYNGDELRQFVDEWLPRLNAEQRRVFNYVDMLCAQDGPVFGCSNAIMLSAAAGTGKSALCRVIASHLRSRNEIVLCCASSGIAALNLPSGMTAHHLF
jgi:hypothetical protein